MDRFNMRDCKFCFMLVYVLFVGSSTCTADSRNVYEREFAKSRIKRQLGAGGACMQIYTVPRREVMCEPSPEVRDRLEDMDNQLSGYQGQLDSLGERINKLDPDKPKELPPEVREKMNTIDEVKLTQAVRAEVIERLEGKIQNLMDRVENVETTERIEMARLIDQQSSLLETALHHSNSTIHNAYLEKLSESSTEFSERIIALEEDILKKLRSTETGMEERVHASGNTSQTIIELLKERFSISLETLKEKLQTEKGLRDSQYEEVIANTKALELVETQLTVMREHQARYESHESNLRQEISNLKDALQNERDEKESLREKVVNIEDGIVRLANDIGKVKARLNACKNQSVGLNDKIFRLEDHIRRKEHILPKAIKVKDCHDALKYYQPMSGVYMIDPTLSNQPLEVFCDMEKEEGWTIIQSRQDGHIDFFRGWEEYKKGFGDADTEYWLGLQVIHQLMSKRKYQLRIELQDWEGGWHYANYDIFNIASEEDQFKLEVGGYHGDAGDSLTYHNGMPFSTMDKNNDQNNGICATWCRGAWWYKDCFHSNLNGFYYQKGPYVTKTGWGDGVVWRHIQGTNFYSLKSAQMKIRPLQDGVQ